MPPIIIGGGNAYFRELVTRRLRSCCDLLLRDQHLIADITLSEAGEVALDTLSQSLVGAINEVLAAIILEDLWDRAGTLVYPHNAGDSVRSDALLYTIGGGLPAAAFANSLSMGHDPASHISWIQSLAVGGTELRLNNAGGWVLIGSDAFGSITDSPGHFGCTRMECNSSAWFDAGIIIGNNQSVQSFGGAANYGAFYARITGQTNNAPALATGALGNYIYLCENADVSWDFGHPIYLDPTFIIHSRNQSQTQYVAKQHNTVDAKEIVGAGSEVTEHLNPVELADDAFFDLPDASSGFGFFQIGDGEEYAQISWDSAANVTLLLNSANVVNTDTDTNFCLFDNGTSVRVRNRLGAAKKVIFKYNYWTP